MYWFARWRLANCVLNTMWSTKGFSWQNPSTKTIASTSILENKFLYYIIVFVKFFESMCYQNVTLPILYNVYV